MPDLLGRLKTALADRYAIESEIGRGGMAVVFVAEDLKHHRKVAIKVLHPELAVTLAADRFLSEIQIVAGLNHPHILTLHDSGEADGLLYYVMPYVPGESLRDCLERVGELPVEEAVRIAVEVADGLEYAHGQGVIHRDVKPGNLLLSGKHAVITDFGIARAVTAAQEGRMTGTGLGVGTPLYASPEQGAGAETLDGRTDVYSLGCVLYEMLTGEVPLSAATPQAVQARRLVETPAPIHPQRETVPPALDGVITKALAMRPADRWESAEAFGQALLTATMEATPVAKLELAHALGGEMPAVPPTKWSTGRWALLAAAVGVVAAGVWLGTRQTPRETAGAGPGDAAAPAAGPVETKLAVQGTLGDNLQFGAGSYSISPDGELLAYCSQEEREGVWRVWLADLSRPERPHKVLAAGGPCEWLRWTPSGDRVLFFARLDGRSEYYAVSRHGGSAEPFTECPRYNDVFPFFVQLVHLSPDGSRRLFWKTDRKDFRVAPAESCDLSVADSFLVRGDLPYQFPLAWGSRSDRLLVFEGDARGTRQILSSFRLDGAGQSALTTEAQPWPFWWSADEREIAYTRTGPWGSSPDFQRGPMQVMRLSIAPSGEPEGPPREIPWFRDHPVDWFSISADGRRAVVARETNRYRVLLAAPDPSSGDGSALVEPLTDVKAGETWYPFVLWGGRHSVHGIDLSRDGLWLLLPQAVPGGSDLFKIPVGGGAPVRLTRSGLVYGGLWSPDGLFAAFLSPEGDSLRIRLVNADGRSSGPIRGVDPGLPFFPSWGDDRLVLDRSDNLLESVTNLTVQYGQETFTGWQPVEPSPSGEPPTSTFIVDADRSPLVSSTRHRAWSGSAATGADSTALSGWMIWPFVSPDGDKVLFWWSRQAGQEPLGTWWWIAAGPEPELVPFSTVNSPQEWPVGWSRDGTAIYWKVGREIHRWGLDGGRDFLLRLPEGRISCKPRPDKDAPEFLCVEDLSYAELFLVENFDSGGI